MNFKTGILSFTICLGSFFTINAQEVLMPAGIPFSKADQASKSSAIDAIADTLELPFFDDFSSGGKLPNPSHWLDEFVFINNSYTNNPVTIGVATLDAIYSDGNLNGTTAFPFESDFLTSVPINLDYPGRTDIWLSFFYGPKGLGDKPEAQDSLTVEFLAPDSSNWETVWVMPGLDTVHPDPDVDTFMQAFVSIQEERFLKKGFQFRFKNYASLPTNQDRRDKFSNVDHWNIDYVYLDTSRSSNVTALNDISMISSLGSLLKTYEALPWRHFSKAYLTELKPTVDINYRNNDTTTRNVTRVLKITDMTYQYTDSVNGGTVNVQPGELNTFRFPYNYPFVFYDADSTVFQVMSYLITGDLDIKANDSVVRYQRFYNYYAYDDGSAENGYGLKGEGTANASVAYRFKTFKSDTLRGVNMYFLRTLGDYTQDYFQLAVWDHDTDLDGPGELIYSMTGVKPEYQAELNEFFTYRLDTTMVVSGYFYVGWIKTTENLLNVGWDVSNNNRDKIYYNMGQGWQNTAFNGSLMIRPLLGRELGWPAAMKEIPELKLHVYPNPATDYFYVEHSQGPSSGEWTINMFNLQGKLVYAHGSGESWSGSFRHYVGNLPEGLYIIRVSKRGVYNASSKLMIVR